MRNNLLTYILLGLLIAVGQTWLEKITHAEISEGPFTTKWIGSPMVSDNDKYEPTTGWIPDVEIGLRSDGIIIWRKREPKK